jgi:hypothetical protein
MVSFNSVPYPLNGTLSPDQIGIVGTIHDGVIIFQKIISAFLMSP